MEPPGLLVLATVTTNWILSSFGDYPEGEDVLVRKVVTSATSSGVYIAKDFIQELLLEGKGTECAYRRSLKNVKT